jgi:ketosteroid isomerase-like protein
VVGPQFAFRSVFVGVEGRPYRGPEAGQRYFADLAEAWDDFRLEIEDSLDLGDERVLTTLRLRGRGKESGAEFEAHVWSVNGVRDGKIVSGQTFLERREALEALEALEAAGLRE